MHSAWMGTVLTWAAVFQPIRRPHSGPKCSPGRTVPAARRTAVHAVHRGLLYSRSVWYDVREVSDDDRPAISRTQAPSMSCDDRPCALFEGYARHARAAITFI